MQENNPLFCICNLNTFLPYFETTVNEKFLTLQEMNNLLIVYVTETESGDNHVNGLFISFRFTLTTEKTNKQDFFCKHN